MAVVIAIYALTMPGAIDGLAYYLIPDFSKFSPELVIARVRPDVLHTFAGYGHHGYLRFLSRQDHQAHCRVPCANCGFHLRRFPACGPYDHPGSVRCHGLGRCRCSELRSFADVRGSASGVRGHGRHCSCCGYGLLCLGAVRGAYQCSFALQKRAPLSSRTATHCSRAKAIVVVAIWGTIMGIIVSLGYSSLSFIQPLGEGSSILDFMDFLSNSVMMPIVALLTCIFVGWIIEPEDDRGRGDALRPLQTGVSCGRS